MPATRLPVTCAALQQHAHAESTPPSHTTQNTTHHPAPEGTQLNNTVSLGSCHPPTGVLSPAGQRCGQVRLQHPGNIISAHLSWGASPSPVHRLQLSAMPLKPDNTSSTQPAHGWAMCCKQPSLWYKPVTALPYAPAPVVCSGVVFGAHPCHTLRLRHVATGGTTRHPTPGDTHLMHSLLL